MRIFRLTAIALLLFTAAGPAARAADPGAVPPAWSAFAAQVSLHLQQELGDAQDPAATRLHQFLDAQAAKDPSAPPPAPVVRLWFKGRNGRIAQATFASLGDPQADQDLRRMLTAHPVGAAAPHGMRQPLVLRLRLTYPS